MPRFKGVSLQALVERLGPAQSKRFGTGGAHSMTWTCSATADKWCFAHAQADYRSMPPGLDAWQQEMFDTFPFPKEGWTLRACPTHRELFSDYPEEPD